MTQIYNEESKNKGGIHEPLNRSEFLRGPRTDDKVKTSKGGRRDPRTDESVQFLKNNAGIHGPPI